MKIEAFIKWASECQQKHGSRPSSVSLNGRDINEIYDELIDSEAPKAVHSGPPSPKNAAIGEAIKRPGYCMTLVGIDVYRSDSVRVGEFGLN